MGNPDAERLVHRLGHSIRNGQPVASRKPLEARNADLPAPRLQSQGEQMIDPVTLCANIGETPD